MPPYLGFSPIHGHNKVAVRIQGERVCRLFPNCLAYSKYLIDSTIVLKCFQNDNHVLLCKMQFKKKKIKTGFWGRERKSNSPLKCTWRILEGLFQVVIKHLWSKFAHFCPHQFYNIPGIKSALEFKNKTGGTNWIRSRWQTSPQQNVLSIGGSAIKEKMYIFFLNLPSPPDPFSLLAFSILGFHLPRPLIAAPLPPPPENKPHPHRQTLLPKKAPGGAVLWYRICAYWTARRASQKHGRLCCVRL